MGRRGRRVHKHNILGGYKNTTKGCTERTNLIPIYNGKQREIKSKLNWFGIAL